LDGKTAGGLETPGRVFRSIEAKYFQVLAYKSFSASEKIKQGTGSSFALKRSMNFMTVLKMRVLPGKQRDVLEILESVKEDLVGREDCACGIYKQHGDEDTILYIEFWMKKEAMYHHLRSDLYRRILNVMELASETPDIRFHELEKTEGIELVFNLRERTNHYGEI
jgi:quinol monooxygenase YgiN